MDNIIELRKIDHLDNDYKQQIFDVETNILNAYIKSNIAWVVTYSGGKDSSVVLDLVLKCALKHRTGPHIYIVSNDTLVESPLVIDHLKKMHMVIKNYIVKNRLNITVHLTEPDLKNRYWVKLIGKGYPVPNSGFRWCTSRLKIDPTSNFIERTLGDEKLLMTIGTREAESNTRKRTIDKHALSDYYSTHTTNNNCSIFMPLRYLTDGHIWEYLATNTPPWGGDYRDLINLYREAHGGECPVIADTSQLKQPSCGERSPRFGCWTCTLVKNDSSLGGLIDSGYNDLLPLYNFRNWLVKTRDNKENRYPCSRTGVVQYRNDKLIFRGYRIEYRAHILDELLSVQAITKRDLISKDEITLIKEIWCDDQILMDKHKGLKIPLTKTSTSDSVVV